MAAIDSTWLGINGSPLGAMIRAGENSLNKNVGAATSAVGAATGAAGTMRADAGMMRSDAAAMRDQARLVNTEAGKVGLEADALKALIPQLDPYKTKLTDYGDDLAALAAASQSRADDVFGQAGALMRLDPNAGGLAGEYMAHYDLLSPERYVSRYASDAQTAIDNTRGQTERYLARRGVNIGSGANAGLMGTLQRIKEAAMLSAAKSLGYDKGVTERGAFLDKLTGAAKTFFDMGTTAENQTLDATKAAGDMAKGAAGIVSAQGDMTKNVGAMRATVAELFAKGADIFGGAANVTKGAADVEGNAGKLIVDAYKMLIDASDAASKYYQGISQSMIAADAAIQRAQTRARGGGETASKNNSPSGKWVDLTHGKVSHKSGAEWVWDPNA